MLRAHSLLWNYLWIAPNLLLLSLALMLRLRRLHRQYLSFFVFAVVSSLGQLVLYACDVIPSVSAPTFWNVLWIELLVDAVLKFTLIGSLFACIFGSYQSVAQLGRNAIRAVGILLVFGSAVIAALSRVSNPHWIVAGPHLLEQTIYLIECGLLLFVFFFSAYFRLRSERNALGICLGLAISACVHLATWAIAANNSSVELSVYLDFLNMAAYHAGVLIWMYFLLVPHKVVVKPTVSLPDHNLDIWNRELERLLHP
jgi:hypothetical protein